MPLPLAEDLAPYQKWLPPLRAEQMAQLQAHLDLLYVWNRKINLTAIRDTKEAAGRHVAESLFVSGMIPDGECSVCDLGSGGGFPGIPVAIARPRATVTLVESDLRKGVFLREATRGLPNCRVASVRFEEVHESFQFVVTRAVNLAMVDTGPVSENVLFLTRETRGPASGFYRNWNWTAREIPWSAGSWVMHGTPVNIV